MVITFVVLYPTKITDLSNGNDNSDDDSFVLYPTKITDLSNAITGIRRSSKFCTLRK